MPAIAVILVVDSLRESTTSIFVTTQVSNETCVVAHSRLGLL